MLSASGAPESWFHRLKELFRHPRTGWEKIARAAWVFAILCFLATAITAFARWTWPTWLRPPLDTGFGVALVVVSIWLGGIFTDFYSKLTGFGIIGVRENRRGQDPDLTGLVPDHALVLSRNHATSSAQFPEPLLRELQDIINQWVAANRCAGQNSACLRTRSSVRRRLTRWMRHLPLPSASRPNRWRCESATDRGIFV